MSDTDGWRIPARAEQCSGCQTTLAVGDDVTVLLRMGDEGPTRDDLCEDCGAALESSGENVYWRRPLRESEAASPVVDYALLREMFDRMLQRTEPVYQRLSYLVGLVLLRKRHLRLKGFEVRDGREVMVVVRGAGQPEMEVPAPHLSADELVETREQLTRLLAADLPALDDERPAGQPDPIDAAVAAGAEAAAQAEASESSAVEDAEGDAEQAPEVVEATEVEDEVTEAEAEAGGPRPELN